MSAELEDLTTRLSNLPQVETSEAREYQIWADSLGTSVVELKQAVRSVGHSADAVKKYLESRT